MSSGWLAEQNVTPEDRRIYNQERLKEEAALGIYALMERENVSRAELAERIGRSRGFITKVLGGSHNFTLETLADIYFGLGRHPHLALGVRPFEVRDPVDEQWHGVRVPMPQWDELVNTSVDWQEPRP